MDENSTCLEPQDTFTLPAATVALHTGVRTQRAISPRRHLVRRQIPATPKVSVVIPALNEAANLLHVLPLLAKGMRSDTR